jgi:hypothetical protein
VLFVLYFAGILLLADILAAFLVAGELGGKYENEKNNCVVSFTFYSAVKLEF